MKSIYHLMLAILALASSCRLTNVPETRTESGPYVQLKNGKKYEGTTAQRSKSVFGKDKVVLGDTSFKTKDVAFYSTGGVTYANIGRKSFATQVATGKINLYKYVTTSSHSSYSSFGSVSNGGGGGWSSSSSTHISYYIQKGEGSPVKTLNYSHLASMISPHTPEYKILEQYHSKRTVSRILGYGSLGLLATGSVLITSNSSSTSNIGGALIGASVGTFIAWGVVYLTNQGRLLKSVIVADKYQGKEHHKRVK